MICILHSGQQLEVNSLSRFETQRKIRITHKSHTYLSQSLSISLSPLSTLHSIDFVFGLSGLFTNSEVAAFCFTVVVLFYCMFNRQLTYEVCRFIMFDLIQKICRIWLKEWKDIIERKFFY